MTRTEAMKQAQRIYRLKIQDGEQYKLNEAKRQRKRYELTRNYKDVKVIGERRSNCYTAINQTAKYFYSIGKNTIEITKNHHA